MRGDRRSVVDASAIHVQDLPDRRGQCVLRRRTFLFSHALRRLSSTGKVENSEVRRLMSRSLGQLLDPCEPSEYIGRALTNMERLDPDRRGRDRRIVVRPNWLTACSLTSSNLSVLPSWINIHFCRGVGRRRDGYTAQEGRIFSPLRDTRLPWFY